MVDKNIEGIVCGVHTLEGTVLYELRKSLKKDFFFIGTWEKKQFLT